MAIEFSHQLQLSYDENTLSTMFKNTFGGFFNRSNANATVNPVLPPPSYPPPSSVSAPSSAAAHPGAGAAAGASQAQVQKTAAVKVDEVKSEKVAPVDAKGMSIFCFLILLTMFSVPII